MGLNQILVLGVKVGQLSRVIGDKNGKLMERGTNEMVALFRLIHEDIRLLLF